MINRNYKDRVFIKLFGSEEYKENLLELYNALNDTDYKNINDLEITTIDNVIYMGYKNDISFMISDEMTLYEHMSSYNPNMPLRGLIYFAKQYEKYIAGYHIDIYNSKLVEIPEPRYYIFYNGIKDTEDEVILRLSDSFKKKEYPGEMEWTAHMLNINYGKNKKLFEKCKTLEEYAILINTIRKRIGQGENQESAVSNAVDECLEKGILKQFLLEHKAEVVGMLLTEFDEEKYLENLKREYIEEGEKIGWEEGEKFARKTSIEIIKALKEGKSIESIAKELEVSIEEVREISDAIN